MMYKTAQKYFDLAYEYHVAALSLYRSLFDASYLYNPTAFNLRHSVELLLKGLIIKETQKLQKIATKNIKIGKYKLNQSHSLLELWNYFKRLYPMNEESVSKLDKAIRKLNKKDFGSDRYRYPYKKNGQPIPVEPVAFDISGKAPDLEEGIPYVIQTSSDAKIVTSGAVLLLDLKTLFEEMEILFDISEKP